MIEIDGAEGGGQLLRTSLTLSAITGQKFAIKNIRGDRDNPGLKKQHLKCIEAVKKLSDADVKNSEIGSREITFKPNELKAKDFSINIGTAGSVNLVIDTLMPLTIVLENFSVTVKGGTDVKWSPTSLNQKHTKIDFLNSIGFDFSYNCIRSGYYPKGDGEVDFKAGNSNPEKYSETKKEDLNKFRIDSKASKSLNSSNVADRQAKELERLLKNNISPSIKVEKNIGYEKTASTGSALNLTAFYENSVAGFDELGEKGKRSEKIAKGVYTDFREFHELKASINTVLGDQLMVYAGLLGWGYTVPKLSNHIETNLEVVNKFLDDNLVIENFEGVFVIKGKKKVV